MLDAPPHRRCALLRRALGSCSAHVGPAGRADTASSPLDGASALLFHAATKAQPHSFAPAASPPGGPPAPAGAHGHHAGAPLPDCGVLCQQPHSLVEHRLRGGGRRQGWRQGCRQPPQQSRCIAFGALGRLQGTRLLPQPPPPPSAHTPWRRSTRAHSPAGPCGWLGRTARRAAAAPCCCSRRWRPSSRPSAAPASPAPRTPSPLRRRPPCAAAAAAPASRGPSRWWQCSSTRPRCSRRGAAPRHCSPARPPAPAGPARSCARRH